MELFLEEHQGLIWVAFNLLILLLLSLDLGLFHRKSHTVGIKESLTWTAVWIGLALAFNVALYFWKSGVYGHEKGTEVALQFLTGYVIEKSLSVDNVFVFLLLFSYFRVPSEYQHRVLFWGIIGALVLRAIFIVVGSVLITAFHWIIYLFGALLIVTGIKMALSKGKEIHPEKNVVLRLVRRFLPMSDRFDGSRFFTRQAGRRLATPLFVVLLLIETSDVIFAVDSIPAIFAVTTDPFIVYSSNVFALLGLRSLYFALASVMRLFHHLHYGLSVILIFVGIKMMAADLYKVPIGLSLGVIIGVLALSVLASRIWPARTTDDTIRS
jgi:tellurite resistance protein TerC